MEYSTVHNIYMLLGVSGKPDVDTIYRQIK